MSDGDNDRDGDNDSPFGMYVVARSTFYQMPITLFVFARFFLKFFIII